MIYVAGNRYSPGTRVALLRVSNDGATVNLGVVQAAIAVVTVEGTKLHYNVDTLTGAFHFVDENDLVEVTGHPWDDDRLGAAILARLLPKRTPEPYVAQEPQPPAEVPTEPITVETVEGIPF